MSQPVIVVRKLGFRNWMCHVVGVALVTDVRTSRRALNLGLGLVSGTM